MTDSSPDTGQAAEPGPVSRLLAEFARASEDRLATCCRKMGHVAKAGERNGELLKRWAKADPDIPLVVEAKAIQERLATATAGTGSTR